MAVLDLSSAELKLWRAKAHLSNAQVIAQRFVSNHFYSVTKGQDRNGWHFIKLASLIEPTPDISLTIGDAASCLRASLDHIAFECASKCAIKPLTSKEEKRIQFPICSTRKAWIAEGKPRLTNLSKRAITVIDRFQPYHYRKEPNTKWLRIVHAVNNWDKHRRIALTGTKAEEIRVTYSRPDLVSRTRTHNGYLKAGTALLRFLLVPGASRADVEVKFKIIVLPYFASSMPREVIGKSAIASLVRAYNFIHSTVLPAFRVL